eukprot:UN03793
MSGVSGSVVSQKNLQRMELILGGKKIQYKLVDISLEENAKDKDIMIKNSKSATPRMTPQVFLGEQYIADFKQIDEWNEYEELEQNLL